MIWLFAAMFVAFGLVSCIEDNKTESDVPRMINGTAARPGQFPFMVHIRGIANIYACSGALITSQKVLTAAHCYSNFTGQCPNCPLGKCMAGDVYKFQSNNSAWSREERMAINLVIHPKYVRYGIPYDFAIVTTSKPFSLTKNIAIIPLAYNDMIAGEACFSIGFGLQSLKESSHPNLAWIQAKVFTRRCSSDRICTVSSHQTVYDGDSGSPLIGNIYDPVVYGVLHGFIDRESPETGAVYASVNANRDWIMMNIEETPTRSRKGRVSEDLTVLLIILQTKSIFNFQVNQLTNCFSLAAISI